MTPTTRNPNNDPPYLGEMIHYQRGPEETIAFVCEWPQGPSFPAMVLSSAGPEVRILGFDEYDPDSNFPYTWHFHHHGT